MFAMVTSEGQRSPVDVPRGRMQRICPHWPVSTALLLFCNSVRLAYTSSNDEPRDSSLMQVPRIVLGIESETDHSSRFPRRWPYRKGPQTASNHRGEHSRMCSRNSGFSLTERKSDHPRVPNFWVFSQWFWGVREVVFRSKVIENEEIRSTTASPRRA